MKNRRNFIKTGLVMGAGFPLASGFANAIAANFQRIAKFGGEGPSMIHTFDARPLQKLDLRAPANAEAVWETLHLLAALQGLANRRGPRLYLFYCNAFAVDTDQFWFDWFRGEDGWLKNTRIRPLSDVADAVSTFRDAFDGLVVGDPNVPATSNLASTAAGAHRLLPVRLNRSPTSLFTRLAVQMRLPVKLWLVNPDGTSKFTGTGRVPDYDIPSSGSAKVDAYQWAARRWLNPGARAPNAGAYYVDAWWLRRPLNGGPEMHTLTNHDWFIARRAFFFDLSPWADERPVDDPRQPLGADRSCLLSILRGLYHCAHGGIVKVGGFPPWPFKYTTFGGAGKHDGVPTEWEFIRILSQFNAYAEADAAGLGAMANASFFQHYPLQSHYRQPNPKPAPRQWKSRGHVGRDGRVAKKLFVGHYVGDYDGPSWLYKAVPKFFLDPSRGEVPLGWAFDPNLADRAPQALAYAFRHATANDFFIAGDSGAGYLNPRGLIERPDSRLPEGLNAWRRYCRRYFDIWGMTITGFILEGASGATTQSEFKAYRQFSPDGLGTQFEPGPAVVSGVAICPERDLPESADDAAGEIARQAMARPDTTQFLWARATLKSPGWYADVSRALRQRFPGLPVEIVDPYTFFGLIRLMDPD
ncbi:MAG: GxGYxYP domain-containing protein [Limisphaerales bacterium]